MPPPIMVTRWGLIPESRYDYVVCSPCGSVYREGRLHELGTRYALECGSKTLCVHCCNAPPSSVIGPTANIKFLVCRYGADYGPAPKFDAGVLESAKLPQPDKSDAEREPAVCRWCKGAREITINFKTKPCDCVKQERADNSIFDIDMRGDWMVKKTFKTQYLNQPV